MRRAALFSIVLVPSVALGASPAELRVAGSAVVEGSRVPVQATITATSSEVELSAARKAGSVPVTITVYVSRKQRPVATSSQAAAVESSQAIQNSIAGVSPGAAEAAAPFFRLVDGGRAAAAHTLETQLESVKKNLGPDAGSPGSVLSAESAKDASRDPMGALWRILRTLYLYLLTILLFLVSSAGVFYPILAAAFLYALWRVFKRFRRT